MGEAGGERCLEAEVAGEFEEFEARVAGGVGADEGGGVVAAAVVDEDGAPRAVALGVEERGEAGEEFGEHGVLVEDRDDEGDGRERRGGVHAGRALMAGRRVRRKRARGV